ncbi:MAG TPA: hypothetical protein DDY14_11060 [Chromatiaceae bacterium]|nr:MAG: hypothetical protein N838_24030 [Thiohalocapsa sp. PB-PSB1]HBG95833.1 hypothetical protein [Chromatiaceae bacterium]HCS91536.1 hypothetical protein [Chromatiaceae bacterium]
MPRQSPGLAADPRPLSRNFVFGLLESLVKQLVIFVLLSIALALTGCGTLPSGAVPVGNISNLPQTMLNGAKLDHARSIAMGMARSKGWTIKTADANRLLLEREWSASSPEATMLESNLTPPIMEVETNLVERSDGTIVALKAFAIRNPGTAEQERIDYTSRAENMLLISLSSLQSAWIESRAKIASTIPIPSSEDISEQSESQVDSPSDPPADSQLVSGADATQDGATTAGAPEPMQTTTAAIAQQQLVAPTIDEPEPPAALSADTTAALPTASSQGLPESATPAVAPAVEQVTESPGEAAVRNDMLVLNNNTRKGLWAYYAEDFARLRGCAIGERGALLMQETTAFELHEVECIGGPNLLVKCQGGVCEGMR